MQLYAFFILAQFALATRSATIPDNTQAAQESLQRLRESFIAQIDTLTEDVGTFLNGNRSNNFSPGEEPNKGTFLNGNRTNNFNPAEEPNKGTLLNGNRTNNFNPAEEPNKGTFLNGNRTNNFNPPEEPNKGTFLNGNRTNNFNPAEEPNKGTFLNGNRTNNFSPAEEPNKASLENIRSGLITFKNDFSKGLKILEDYIQFKAASKMLERSNPRSGAGNMQTFITHFATNIQNGFASVTNSLNNYVIGDQSDFNQGQQVSIDSSEFVSPAEASAPVSSVDSSAPMSSAEASASVSSAPALAAVPPAETFADGLSLPGGSSLSSDISQFMKLMQAYQNLRNAYDTCVKKPLQSAQDLGSEAGIKFPQNPLQDNSSNQRIAERVQNLDPEKPQELEKAKAVSGVLLNEDEKTELSSDSGDINSSDDGEVKNSDPTKEVQKDTLSEKAAKPERTEEFAEKTE